MRVIYYTDLVKAINDADHKTGNITVDLVYLKCNRTKNTGGEWVTLTGVKKCGLPWNCNDHEMRGFVDPTGKVTPVHLRNIYEFNGQQVSP